MNACSFPGVFRNVFMQPEINKMKYIQSLVLPTVILFALLACGRPPLDKPPIKSLESENLHIGQTDSIYQYTKNFPNDLQMAFAIIQNGGVSFYGINRINDTLKTIDNSGKAFEIGSITKVFTATLLANFVVKGEVALDSNINQYFDFPFHDHLTFTFRELANHTSGLPRLPSNIRMAAIFNSNDPYKDYDEEKLDEYLKNDISLDYPKGSKSEYSNLGMGLASYALRKHSGRSFEELAKELIFDKYGMSHSTADRSKVVDILIGGLSDRGKPTPNWSPGALVGAGGIYSTVEDLSRFAVAQFDTSNLELALTREKTFKENEFRDVGLGWFIINTKSGDKWYWHNGGTGGYTSSMVVDVEHKNGIIILSNISSYHAKFKNIDKLAFSLLKTLDRKQLENRQ